MGNVLKLPHVERSRSTGTGTIDAMAEALLISRADIFIRLVVGTHGFSSFAYLSNALRLQGNWASSLPALRKGTERYAPNYVVSDECGPSRCFKASPEVQMTDLLWHAPEVLQR